MKKLFIAFILCSLLKLSAFGQPDFMKVYYPLINRAELAIIDSKYESALLSYDSAFKQVSKPFSRDYLNATIAAIKTGNTKLAYRYCDSLISKGVKKDFFLNYGSFRPLWENSEWQNFIDSFDEKYLHFNKHRDTSLKRLFITLSDCDQEFRRKTGSYRAYGDTIRKIDSQNVAILRHIVNTIGFPNENMTGIADPTPIMFPTYIVFHHYAQGFSKNSDGKYNFIYDYITAVKKGELNPHRFAFLLDLQGERSIPLGGWGVSKATLGNKHSKLLGDLYTPERKALINKTRPMYGLETLEEYYKKAVFALKNERGHEFAFRVYEHINIFEMEDDDQFEKFLLASEIIEY
jgi:hypothetical protein